MHHATNKFFSEILNMQASVELETAARAVQHASRRFLVTRRGRAQRRANSTSTAPLLPAAEAEIAPHLAAVELW